MTNGDSKSEADNKCREGSRGNRSTAIGMSLGMCFGVAFGAAFDEVGDGLVVGMMLGL